MQTPVRTPDPPARLLRRAAAAPRSIPEQIAEQIGAAIIAGERAPGERLVEADLAELYGVSRGPIRESLRILERRRLIDLLPRRGAYVRAVSLNSIADLFNARMALSGLAVRIMAATRPQSYIDTLRRRIEELRTMAQDERASPLDFAYIVTRSIKTIARGSANELIVDLLTDLANQTVWTTIWQNPLDYLTPDSRRRTVDELEAVLQAIERGDGADAEARLRRFLEDDRDQAIGVLARKRGEQVDAFRLLRSEPPSAQSQDA